MVGAFSDPTERTTPPGGGCSPVLSPHSAVAESLHSLTECCLRWFFSSRQLFVERTTHDAGICHLRVADDAGFVDVLVREADLGDGCCIFSSSLESSKGVGISGQRMRQRPFAYRSLSDERSSHPRLCDHQ